ncbi:MAG: GlsB/YeaQ/YmgE family stress response membrane protein [Komarekiella atlantica HA4396-MV6]|nr:GlsB/YeaQ/YmgE family stress response membrane protein [Komarekiella atlantica HA4396-MV6]
MNIIVWVALGLLAGAIANAVYPGYQGGEILSTIILGIIGAFIGGSLLTLLQTGTLQLTAAGAGLSITGILVAVLGAIIVIYLWVLLRRSSNT